MALNQVIHGSNRVVENPNRYRLNPVAGQANTYDFEKQPGVITDNGTPYNKLILDKIDNVLSYLTPSMEKVEGQPIIKSINNYSVKTITPQFAQGNTFNNASGDTELGTFKMSTSQNGFYSRNTTSTGNTTIYSKSSGSTYQEYSHFLTRLNARSGDVNSNYILIQPTVSDANILFTYDFGVLTSATINYKFQLSNINGTIEASNDGTNWVTIVNSINTTGTYNFADYKQIRINLLTTSSSSSAFMSYFYFDNMTYKEISYQNQFTLDNNVNAFTNNQRVLVETPYFENEIISEETKTISSFSGTQPTFSSDDNDINVNTIKSSNDINVTASSGDLLFNGNTFNNTYEWEFYLTNNSKNEKIKKLYIKAYNGTITQKSSYYKLSISGYNPNTGTYEIIDDDYSTSNSFTYLDLGNNNYTKIKFTQTNKGSSSQLINIYIQNIEFVKTLITKINVTTNTLNGIDIPKLLQPSTKYELIYKEDTNKFIINEKAPLYDITLTENVNQVNLTGISNMLEICKIYCLIVVGENDNASGQVGISFGSSSLGAFDKSYPTFILFTPFISNSKLNIETINGSGINSNVISNTSIITDYENVRLSSGYNFKAGTRIIIKEVA